MTASQGSGQTPSLFLSLHKPGFPQLQYKLFGLSRPMDLQIAAEKNKKWLQINSTDLVIFQIIFLYLVCTDTLSTS